MADFIGMTRRLHADPDYVNKVRAGRMDDIAPCTACDNCLGTKRCRINALLGTAVHRHREGPQEEEGARHRRRPRRAWKPLGCRPCAATT